MKDENDVTVTPFLVGWLRAKRGIKPMSVLQSFVCTYRRLPALLPPPMSGPRAIREPRDEKLMDFGYFGHGEVTAAATIEPPVGY